MYFFRVELKCFDDDSKIMFLTPEQTDADEKGIPFSEKLLTNSPEFKDFVKETQTPVVDVTYATYKCDANVTKMDEDTFNNLDIEGLLTKTDGNSFPISTGKDKKFDVNKLLKDKKLLIIAGAAVVLLIIIIAIAANAGKSPDKQPPESSEVTSSSESSESSSSSTESSSSASSTTSEPTESSTSSSTSSSSSDYVDEPTTSEPTTTTDSGGYTDSGYGGGGSSGGQSGTYTISFNLCGGTGEIAPITAEAGQYVRLPKADVAAKSVHKAGYKLIGFSDNTEILYPLYNYKMPYNNVTLFAVWEPDTFVVTYNSNGGTGTLSRAEVKYGDEVPLPTDVAVYNDELHLAGWAKTSSAKSALKSLKMPAEDLTLYAIWSERKPMKKINLHYDDSVQVIEKEVGSTVNMLDSFGVQKDGYSVEGWYFEDSPKRVENLYVSEDCHLYAKWQKAEYVTITVDRSYLNKAAETYKVPLDMTGKATLKLPVVDDKNDIYNHVEGCTYGYSTKRQSGEFGTIEYFGGVDSSFTRDTTLYRVLSEYGGGAGTRENPYLISYYDQLLRLADKGASGYFKQTADITFPANISRKPIDTKRISRGYENKNYDFFVYDGQNFVIKNLTGNGGLFGNIAGATIKNVVVNGADIGVGSYANVGVICDNVISYSFKSADGSADYATGNTRIEHCSVYNAKIRAENAPNVGGICGNGGIITDCFVSELTVNGGKNAGGIVGNAYSVTGSLVNGFNANGTSNSAGGIAGTAYGAEIYDNGTTPYKSGGNIIGCGVRTFTSAAKNSGGIVGTSTAISNNAYIKSCYVANIYLNGANNGGIAGADGAHNPHRIAYCIVDNTNKYPSVGGEKFTSISKVMVIAVPADSGLTVDGVLSVLNAASSGYDKWERGNRVNDGYPYPRGVFD